MKKTSNQFIFDDEWEMLQIKQWKDGRFACYINVNNAWHVSVGSSLLEAFERAEEKIKVRQDFRKRHNLDPKGNVIETKIEDLF